MQAYELPDAAKHRIEEISARVLDLENSASFFRELDNLDSNFEGALHCEACLASLVAPASDQHANNDTIRALVVSFYV